MKMKNYIFRLNFEPSSDRKITVIISYALKMAKNWAEIINFSFSSTLTIFYLLICALISTDFDVSFLVCYFYNKKKMDCVLRIFMRSKAKHSYFFIEFFCKCNSWKTASVLVSRIISVCSSRHKNPSPMHSTARTQKNAN